MSEYRAAVPDEEGGSQFTPGIWARIEVRRGESRWFGRIARGFVTASGVICLALSAAIWMPQGSVVPPSGATYVDVLADDSAADDAIETELAHSEP